jgi:hypothetical protein
MEVGSFEWSTIATQGSTKLSDMRQTAALLREIHVKFSVNEVLATLTSMNGATKVLICVKKLRRRCKVRMSLYRNCWSQNGRKGKLRVCAFYQ